MLPPIGEFCVHTLLSGTIGLATYAQAIYLNIMIGTF